MTISVLMPAYNSESSIAQSVRSTLRALPSDSELLVWLDGCTDKTALNLEPCLVDKRLRVFESTKNRGVAHSLNSLWELSRFTYVARMDADDYCLPWRFRLQMEQMNKFGSDLLFSSAIIRKEILGLGMYFLRGQAIKSSQAHYRKLVKGNPLIHPTMFGKKSAFPQQNPYPNVPAEDYALWLSLASDGRTFRSSSLPTIIYRLHENQISRQRAWRELNDSSEVITNLKNQLNEALANHES